MKHVRLLEPMSNHVYATCPSFLLSCMSNLPWVEISSTTNELFRSRAADIDSAARYGRLDQFLRPIISQWQNPGLGQRLSSYASFCELLGLSDVQKYLSARGVHRIQDWSSQPLDNEGKALQQRMTVSLEVRNAMDGNSVLRKLTFFGCSRASQFELRRRC